MATDKQIQANRRHAQRSTGPQTPAGKAASSRNAVTHGLLARDTVVYGERPDDLQRLRQAYLDHFQPASPAAEFLVRQFTSAHWRLQRLERVEAGLFDTLIDQVNEARADHARLYRLPEDPEPHTEAEPFDRDTDTLGQAFLRDCGTAASLAILNRYETSLRQSYYKALHDLQRLQAPQPPAPTLPAPESGFVSQSPAPTPTPAAAPSAAGPAAAPPAPRIGFLSQSPAPTPTPVDAPSGAGPCRSRSNGICCASPRRP